MQTNTTPIISLYDYFTALMDILRKIDYDFDCIVAVKRSGWMMGTFLSNQFNKPLFTVSEISSIPEKFKNVLIVDDKICTGKSLSKPNNRLKRMGKETKCACLFVEGILYPDYYSKSLNSKIIKMWYEKRV